MRNFNNEIVQFKNEYFLLNSDFASAERLQLTDTENIQEVEGNHYVYLVDTNNQTGKAFLFDNINKASHMYNKYMSSMSDSYMTHTYIEIGIQLDEGSYRIHYNKNEEE